MSINNERATSHGGLIVSVLNSGLNCSALSLDWGHYIVLSKTLNQHFCNASLHPGEQMGSAEFRAGVNPVDWHLIHAVEYRDMQLKWQYGPLGLIQTKYLAIHLSF